jgi:hypothetical protein
VISNKNIKWLRSTPTGISGVSPQFLAERFPLESLEPEHRSKSLTYFDYFNKIEDFFLQHRETFVSIFAAETTENSRPEVSIICEKHGSDYHPARILLMSDAHHRSFAVNVALTERGLDRIEQDYRIMNTLQSSFHRTFVPKPYFFSKNGEYIAFMVAEWFESHHEFHPTRRNDDYEITIWDVQNGYYVLNREQELEVYRQAAYIFAYYFDLNTSKEIYPWHHAAGDFVVSTANNVDVKLITVRQYAARFGSGDSKEMRLMGFIFFVLNTTLRMRLDRLEGIGEIIWLRQEVVDSVLRGMFDALKTKISENSCEPGFLQETLQHLKTYSVIELAELFSTVIDSYDPRSPDTPTVQNNAAEHILYFARSISNFDPS